MGYDVSQSDLRQGVVGVAFATNFPAGAAPQVLNGASVRMARVEPETLSAHVRVTAQTTDITMYAQWQVSMNGTNWYNAKGSTNSANVVLATGTAGADTAVDVVLSAPESCTAWRYARVQLYTGAASATTGDLGGIQYYYRENNL